MNPDVFLALLALDSYNRGYNQTLSGLLNTGSIGSATIFRQSNIDENSAEVGAGFYAIAYNWNNKTIISYRGTDNYQLLDSASDLWTGWGIGGGFTFPSQAALAIAFYEDIKGGSIYEGSDVSSVTGKPIVTVGHSLGGGLAGFVGALGYGDSYGFDHMPFLEAAAAQAFSVALTRAIAAASAQLEEPLSISNLITWLPLGTDGPLDTAYEAFVDTFIDSLNELEPFLGTMSAYHLDGEVLEAIRTGDPEVLANLIGGTLLGDLLAQMFNNSAIGPALLASGIFASSAIADSALVTNEEVSNYGIDPERLDEVDLHSQALLTILLFGERQWESEGGGIQWQQSVRYVAPGLLSDVIGGQIGLVQDADAGDNMAAMVAYSLIDDGQRVFGDTAIRALFDDMDQFGEALANLPAFINEKVRFEIGNVLVEFAGLLAKNKILSDDRPQALNGVLGIAEGGGGTALTIDFTDTTWSLNGTLPQAHDVYSRVTFIESIFEAAFGQSADPVTAQFVYHELQTWLAVREGNSLLSPFRSVDSVSITLMPGLLLDEANSTTRQLIVGSDQVEEFTINGSPAIVLAGGGSDTIFGTEGDDALIGGDGNDILSGGDGENYLHGGAGNDFLVSEGVGDRLIGGDDDDIITGAGAGTFIEGGDGNDELHLYHGDIALGGAGADKFYIYTDRASPSGTTPFYGEIKNLILDMDESDELYVDGVLYTGRIETAQLINPYYEGEIGAIVYEFDVNASSSFGENDTRWSEVRFSSNRSHSYGGPNSDLRLTDIAQIKFNPGGDTWTSVVMADFQPGDGGMEFLFAYEYDWLGGYGDYTQDVRYTDGISLSPVYHDSDGHQHWDWGSTFETVIYEDYLFNDLDSEWLDSIPSDLILRDYYHALLNNAGAPSMFGSDLGETLVASSQLHNVFGFGGNDTLSGTVASNLLFGGEGDDVLYGGAGDDQLYGGGGTDMMAGGIGDDWYHVDDAGDLVTESADEGWDFVEAGVSYVLGANIEDLSLFGSSTPTNGTGNALNNELYGDDWENVLSGLGGNDVLMGAAGNDTLDGGTDNDTLEGLEGGDTLIGGAGNDLLIGWSGNDTYIFNLGDGQDTIRDFSSITLESNQDTLRFGAGIAVADLLVTQVDGGADLLLSIAGTTDSVLLDNTISDDAARIEQVEFADGTTLTYAQLVALTEANHAPEVSLGLTDRHVAEDTAIDFELPANAFADVDGDPLTLSANLEDGTALPTWLSFDGARFTGTAPLDYNGPLGIVVAASDGEDFITDGFTLVIDPVNDAPIAEGAFSDQEIVVGEQFTLGIAAVAFGDVDGDTLTVSASLADGSALPSWITFDGTSFSGTAPVNTGTFNVRVSASDGQAAVSADFDLTVIEDTPSNGSIPYPVTTNTVAFDESEMFGTAGNDLIIAAGGNYGYIWALGFGGDDHMTAGNWNSALSGGAGVDVIEVRDYAKVAGDDEIDIYGDVISLSSIRYADYFVFNPTEWLGPGWALDPEYEYAKIADFDDGLDKIAILEGGASSDEFADLTITQNGADTEIFGAGIPHIVLQNTASGNIDAGDFIFF